MQKTRYSTVAIVLHWLIAAAILVQLMLALRMQGPSSPGTFAVFQLHKSVGVTILALSLVRLAWRVINPPPPPIPATLARWERRLAKFTHAFFYVFMVGMPLTGWLAVSASPLRIPTVLYGVIPWPDVPGLAHLSDATRKVIQNIGGGGHESLAIGFLVLLVLHVAGALKHQLLGRDEPVLARMAPGAVAGRRLEPRLFLIAAGAAAALAFGYTVKPPPPGVAPPPAVTALPAAPVAVDHATWIIEPGSTLTFATTWTGQPVTGRFTRWRARIAFDPDRLEGASADVSIDLTSADTGDRQRDAVLPSADWFDAAARPQATFTAGRFEKVGKGRYIAHGELSLKGVTQPVDLPFSLAMEGAAAHATGEAGIDRKTFGVGRGQGADQIPAKVTVRLDLRAHHG